MSSLAVAVAQLPITGDARENGRRVRAAMVGAAASSVNGNHKIELVSRARLVLEIIEAQVVHDLHSNAFFSTAVASWPSRCSGTSATWPSSRRQLSS